jgi:L-aspartate oxidase
VHGANRLASNSLLESVVFGKRVVQRTEMSSSSGHGDGEPKLRVKRGESEEANSHFLPDRESLPSVPPLNLPDLQSLMWDKVGIIRSGESLAEAAGVLATWQRFLPQSIDRPSYELNNLILCARLMAEAALLREESRGAHFRTDFPQPSSAWQRHIIFRKQTC